MTQDEGSGGSGRIAAVQVGRIAPLGPGRVRSAIVKQPVTGAVEVATLGLAGDEQADLRVHGGPEKAVYAYARASYARWQAERPEHAQLLVPGGMGENLTLEGMDEESVCLADTVQAGTATLQVSQPRQPCFKFALRFDDNTMPRAMTRNGLSGWYYRVLAPGTVAAGDRVTLLHRPAPGWSVARFNALLRHRAAPPAELRELAALDGLAEEWRAMAQRGLGVT